MKEFYMTKQRKWNDSAVIFPTTAKHFLRKCMKWTSDLILYAKKNNADDEDDSAWEINVLVISTEPKAGVRGIRWEMSWKELKWASKTSKWNWLLNLIKTCKMDFAHIRFFHLIWKKSLLHFEFSSSSSSSASFYYVTYIIRWRRKKKGNHKNFKFLIVIHFTHTYYLTNLSMKLLIMQHTDIGIKYSVLSFSLMYSFEPVWFDVWCDMIYGCIVIVSLLEANPKKALVGKNP